MRKPILSVPITRTLILGLVAVLSVHTATGAQTQPSAKKPRNLLVEARDLLLRSSEQDRRTLGNAIVDAHIARKDLEGALEFAVEMDLRDAWMFSRIAEMHVQAGRIERAIEVASMPGTPETRAQALGQLAQSLRSHGRVDAAVRVMGMAGNTPESLNSMFDVGYSTAISDSVAQAMLRPLLTGLRGDTTFQGRDMLVRLAALLAQRRDTLGFHILDSLDGTHVNGIHHVMNAASILRSRGNFFADTLYAVALRMAEAIPDSGMRRSSIVNFWTQYRAVVPPKNWRLAADTILDVEIRRAFLYQFANVDYRWSPTTAARIGEYLLEKGDSVGAREFLFNAAESAARAYQYSMNLPGWETISAVEANGLFRRVLQISTPQNGRMVDYRYKQAAAWRVKLDPDYANELAADSIFPRIEPHIATAVVESMMATDLHRGLALALTLPDTAAGDRFLQTGAEGLVNAGLVEAGIKVAQRIRNPRVRIQPLMRAAERKVRSGEVAAAQGLVREAMQLVDVRADFHGTLQSVVAIAAVVGMTDEVLAWADKLPEENRVFVLVALVRRMGI